MSIYLFISQLFLQVLGVIFLVKLGLFFQFKTKEWRMHNLIYFSGEHIILSGNSGREKVKRIENMLTDVGICVICIYVLYTLSVFMFPIIVMLAF